MRNVYIENKSLDETLETYLSFVKPIGEEEIKTIDAASEGTACSPVRLGGCAACCARCAQRGREAWVQSRQDRRDGDLGRREDDSAVGDEFADAGL